MARMPGAVWRPMPGSSTTPMAAHDVLCFHTCVGSLAGTDAYFRSTASGTNSHFGVGGDGTIYQWVDTAYRSGASYNGNYHLISVETADMGAEFAPWSGSNVPAWTPAQVEANARIAAWVADTHGIPLAEIPDSLRTRRGVGYHRLGVPGYMVAGAEQWSTVNKKSCPGDQRISQVPSIIARASAIRGGGSSTPLEQNMSVRIAVAPDKTCWIATTEKVWWSSDIKEVSALAKMWGIPITPMENVEIQRCIDFVSRRKAESDAAVAAAVSKVMPSPSLTVEQVKALADEIVAEVAPKLEDATPLTEADIKRLLDDSEIDTVNLLAARLSKAS